MVAVLSPRAFAEKKKVTIVKEWKGSVDDEAKQKDAPAVIANAKALEKLWKSWKIEGKTPKVDFEKQMVLVTTSRGSKLNLSANLDDKGNLEVLGFGTRDLRPGFRFVLGTVSKDKVKTVNGKALPK
jgi:hypothetical protein